MSRVEICDVQKHDVAVGRLLLTKTDGYEEVESRREGLAPLIVDDDVVMLLVLELLTTDSAVTT